MSKNNFVCQNNSSYSLGWRFLFVPAGYVYGTMNGFDFVATPKVCKEFRKIPVEVYQNGRKVKRVDKPVLAAIIDKIIDCKTLKLSSWDYASDWEKAVKADTIARERKAELREQGMIRSAHANRASAGKKAAHRTKAFRIEQNFFTTEYNDASARIYGTSVEMNGRKRKCSGKTAEYLDGSGCCAVDFDNHDFRPLAPVFPVPSGKKAR